VKPGEMSQRHRFAVLLIEVSSAIVIDLCVDVGHSGSPHDVTPYDLAAGRRSFANNVRRTLRGESLSGFR
jgi:hypothetical protein